MMLTYEDDGFSTVTSGPPPAPATALRRPLLSLSQAFAGLVDDSDDESDLSDEHQQPACCAACTPVCSATTLSRRTNTSSKPMAKSQPVTAKMTQPKGVCRRCVAKHGDATHTYDEHKGKHCPMCEAKVRVLYARSTDASSQDATKIANLASLDFPKSISKATPTVELRTDGAEKVCRPIGHHRAEWRRSIPD